MLSDMADGEGSGYIRSEDDEDYDDEDGSGDGSREGSGENGKILSTITKRLF